MKKVFIIGVTRSGSKLHQKTLNKNSKINISSEIGFLNPWWLGPDFKRVVENKIGDLKNNSNVDMLIDMMYDNLLERTFWKIENGIYSINKEKLRKRIINSNRDLKSIIAILLEEHAKAKNKKIAGAKYPVNIINAQNLYDLFPSAKYIHLIRDPRAVYLSANWNQIQNLLKKSRYAYLIKPFIKILSLMYLKNQYQHSVNFYKKNKNKDNYYLSRFEDVVRNPEKFLKKLYSFLEIEYPKQISLPPLPYREYNKDSGYCSNGKYGFDKKELTKWKKYMSPFSEKYINFFFKKEMNEFGYYEYSMD